MAFGPFSLVLYFQSVMTNRNIKIALFVLVAAVAGVVCFYSYTKAEVSSNDWTYTCFHNGCSYELEVTNWSRKPTLAYVRINAFGIPGAAKMSSQRVIATERREFDLKPDQKMKVSGFIESATKPQQLSYGVGVVDKKI